MRIVSLLPSATEIVCAIGLESELVAVTHECDWPPSVIGKPVVTRDAPDAVLEGSRVIHDRVTASMHGGSSLYVLDENRSVPDQLLGVGARAELGTLGENAVEAGARRVVRNAKEEPCQGAGSSDRRRRTRRTAAPRRRR